MRTAVAIRHVHFEDLGCFRPVLEDAGYEVRYCEAGVDDIAALQDQDVDLLVVLGGPIGACDDAVHPFLADEVAIVAQRLATRRPLLGICLGAQLMARALGARVYPGPSKEIGWSELQLTDAGRASPLRRFESCAVLHWHGDTFDIPHGARRLAATAACANQAFSIGRHALAFQFHPEADGGNFERWLIGHSVEVASAGLSVAALREDCMRHAKQAAAKGQLCLAGWLHQGSRRSKARPPA